MPFIKTAISELLIFDPILHKDSRGHFYESYNQKTFEEAGIIRPFVQDNQSFSHHGVLRGLHLQKGDAAQAKLIRVLKGSILDVVVDLRIDSPTFKKVFTIELNDSNKKELFVPRFFLHGFIVLSETAEVFYKCDNFFIPNSEFGIKYDDQELNIDWKISPEKMIISDKDKSLPSLKEAIKNL